MTEMKIGKVTIGMLTAVLASGALTIAFAQDAAPTKESTQALLSQVSQKVWNARRSSEHNAQMVQAYKAGEAAYFEGNYEKATKKLKAAEGMTMDSPNNVGGGPN
jgi:hypothetical protein